MSGQGQGQGQDWSNVVLRAKQPKKKGAPEVGAGPAQRKFAAGSNVKNVNTNMAKLDADSETLSHQRVGLGLGKSIQQARANKKMTQAALAQAINEKPSVINQYENGKAIPNGMIITKIERALGATLPRPKKK